MSDAECVAFLRWALPRLGFRWRGFRRVRRQVCRRIRARIAELGLPDHAAYRERLLAEPAEWERLAGLCRVTISRFFRGRRLFTDLEETVLPRLAECFGAAGGGRLALWSAGCGAGEEPYSVAILGHLAPTLGGVALEIVGTDVDPVQLARARRAVYPSSSLRDLPPGWLGRAFRPAGDERWRLRRRYRRGVELALQDLRREAPAGPFHLVLCRNLAFTYFDEPLQRRVFETIRRRLRPGGGLVVGSHEEPPAGVPALERWRPSVWRLTG